MTWEMAERWVRSGLAVLIERTAEAICVRTSKGVVFTVWRENTRP